MPTPLSRSCSVSDYVSVLDEKELSLDKIRLRNTLRKLRQIPIDRKDRADSAMLPQEMLDVLAMLAGLKPVYLLGRGFDDRAWIEGVLAIAKFQGLHIVAGPKWMPASRGLDFLPEWFRTLVAETQTDKASVYYICRTRTISEELKAIVSDGQITIEQEARLLCYPECCVSEHYQRGQLVDALLYKLVSRAAKNDEAKMRELILNDVSIGIETEEERSLYAQMTNMHAAPFTSFHMCSDCSSGKSNAANLISAKFEAIARTVDGTLVDQITLASL